MKDSPRGNSIERISGDAWDIQQRGRDMESLGMQMRESASILEKIKNGTEGKGFSVEKIKENVGELHVDLARAGERYQPSGTVIREYGEALASVKNTISTIVDECEELWAIYVAASGDSTTASNKKAPADETPEQKTTREDAAEDAAGDKATAYANWLDEATKYDTPFETWDTAYEAAVSGLQGVNDDGVSDGFWDDALPFIEGALTVLAIAGVVLAVLAIVIGGPIIALLAVIVAVATLVFTIIKVANGRGGAEDLAWAIAGVIPFGRLAQLGSVFKGGTKFTAFLGGLGSDMAGITGFLQKGAVRGFPSVIDNTTFLNRAGNLTGANIVNKISALGDDISELKLWGPSRNPAVWSQRLLGGGSGQLSAGMADAVAGASPNVGNRVSQVLKGGALDGLQNPLSELDKGANLIDTFIKPGNDLEGLITDNIDSSETTNNQNAWQQQLADSK